ncbi:MAG: hypothetical protein Q8O52_14710 [Sulfuritalea sp.]|nr:hypothetical protein [Sulfuritalea sp.]
MTETSIATIGFEDKDLMVLKSLLSLVARGVTWRMVEDPALAQIVFLGRMPQERVAGLVAQFGDRLLLIYCCSRGEEAPPGVRVLGHCPPRANEIAEVLVESVQQASASAATAQRATESAVAARAMRKQFLPERSLIGAIQTIIPKLLIDQPLAVSVPGAPDLLVDVHAGVRTAHADPAWFSSPDFWRADPAVCQIRITTDARLLGECRRFPARAYQALRFWGVMSASQGAPLAEIARATRVGLKKMPDFRLLPHLEWQPRLAEDMVGKLVAPETIVAAAGRPAEEIIDFLNAAAVLGLVRTA